MSVNQKMTALADEIRILSGTTTSKGIDAMTSDVDAANTEIAEQAELLAQITTALEGKASGVEDIDEEVVEYTSLNTELEAVINSLPEAGSGGGGSVETCTVNIISRLGVIHHYGVTQYIDGVITNTIFEFDENATVNVTFENVVCSSFLFFRTLAGVLPAYSVTNGSIVTTENVGQRIWLVSLTSSPNVTETITVWDDD